MQNGHLTLLQHILKQKKFVVHFTETTNCCLIPNFLAMLRNWFRLPELKSKVAEGVRQAQHADRSTAGRNARA